MAPPARVGVGAGGAAEKPVAVNDAILREAARTAGLAAHSAAGLCGARRPLIAASLLRSAEALARAAVAALAPATSAAHCSTAPAKTSPSAPARKRRKRKLRKTAPSGRGPGMQGDADMG